MEHDPLAIGARSEHIAISWLLGRGFEVFKNVSHGGKADLIIREPGSQVFIPIDVKTEGRIYRQRDDVIYLYVRLNGECRFDYEPRLQTIYERHRYRQEMKRYMEKKELPSNSE